LDGSQPNTSSYRYTVPFALPTAGIVRALAAAGGVHSGIVSRQFDVAPRDWRVVSATGDEPENLVKGGAFFGRTNTPVSIVIDLGKNYDLRGFTLKPVFDHTIGSATAAEIGPPARFTVWVSTDGQTWDEPVATGEFPNIAMNRAAQAIRFDVPHAGRYLRLLLPQATQNKPVIAVGGIGILTR